jgi:biopolymer transport protein ExbB
LRFVPPWLVAAMLVGVIGAACAAQAAAPAATAPAAQDANQPAEGQPMSFLELLLKGRWFMVPIGLCSLLGLAVIIERLIVLRRKAVIPPDFMPGLKGIFGRGRGDRTAGLAYCRSRDCPISRVVHAAIRKFHRSEEAVEHAIEDAGANEISKLRRNLRMLYAVAAVAPMLGLLGTVWGMIDAFHVASTLQDVSAMVRYQRLGKGIYEALVTTFAGLTVAIPVLIFYHFFLSRIDRLVHEINEVSVEFMEHYMGAGPQQEARP